MLARVSRITASGTPVSLGRTDEEGQIRLQKRCEQGEVFHAIPLSNWLSEGTVDCRPGESELKIKVRRGDTADWLTVHAESLSLAGNDQVAALLFSDAAFRIDAFNHYAASGYRVKAYREVASTLQFVGEPLVFNATLKDTVMTLEFSLAIRRLQDSLGLTPTGQLDFPTLQRLSGSGLSQWLRRPSGWSPREQPVWVSARDTMANPKVVRPPN